MYAVDIMQGAEKERKGKRKMKERNQDPTCPLGQHENEKTLHKNASRPPPPAVSHVDRSEKNERKKIPLHMPPRSVNRLRSELKNSAIRLLTRPRVRIKRGR
mmetsp:Transcript_36342/g.71525  ORF Transcript_36342/g.71525 Transcript_36342/m.71525 type:complete len:102 (+) Transcript_36342:364-669(+)